MATVETKLNVTATDQTRAAFASILANIDSVKNRASGIASSFGSVATGLASLGLSVGGFVGVVRSAINAADELNKLSQKVGVSVEALSELKFAAELSDVTIEQLQLGMRGLSDTLLKAGDATSKEARLLESLGVSARDPLVAFKQIADAFSRLPDSIEKTGAAGDIFGARVGQGLIPLLNQGSAGLDAMSESARKLGLQISTDTARASEEFNDNLRKLATTTQSLGISLAGGAVKGLAEFTGGLVKAKEEGRLLNKVMQDIVGTALESAAKFPGIVGNFFGRARDAFSSDVAAGERNRGIAAEIMQNAARFGRPEVFGPPAPDDMQARVACTLSGGTWDAAARRCVPKTTGGSGAKHQMSLDELLALGAMKRQQVQEDSERQQEEAADRALKERIDAEADAAIARQRREDEAEAAADAVIERNREIARTYIDIIDPTARLTRALVEVRGLVEQGFMTAEQGREAEFAIQLQIDKLLEARGELRETASLAKELGLTFASAFEDAIVQGKKFADILRGMGQDIARILLRQSVTKPAADALGQLLGGIRIPGFAGGGSFVVGGNGGTDSQLVAFRASPNERVTVETPGQQAGRAQSFSFHIDARGADVGVAARIEDAVRRAVNLSVQAVQAQADRGGSFARSVGRR